MTEQRRRRSRSPKPGRKIRPALSAWFRSIRWRRLLLAAAVFVLTAVFIATTVMPTRVRVALDQPAPATLKAPFDIVDQPTTERLKEEAAAGVADIYDEDEEAVSEALAEISSDFETVKFIRGLSDRTFDQKAVMLENRLGIVFTEDVTGAVFEASPRTLDLMADAAEETLFALSAEGIKPDALDGFRRRVPEMTRTYEFDRPLTAFLSLLVQNRLRPNLHLNEDATMAAREDARAAVEPVIIKRNEVIVSEGQRVSASDLARLRDAGLLQDDVRYPGIIGAVLLSGLLISLMSVYLHFFHPDVFQNESRLVLISLIMLGILAVSRVIFPISGFALPMAAGSMLLALLVQPGIAMFAVALLAAVTGVMAGSQFQMALVALVGGFIGVFSVSRVGQRSDLMRAGFNVGLANALVIITWALVFASAPLTDVELWRDVFWGIIGGFVSAVLTIGTLPFLESFFGILTPVRLLELSNPNQPLLRRLLVEAPGTYHHSIMVANLAEAAAERVGGDSLLTRVGAYYHDIGKMRRPYFFIENQFGGENPHDRISPNLSALIITSHVKDGVDMALEHGLPEELIDFIREHHGTTRVQYFYQRALEETDGEGILEENFAYPGPIPNSRETAILMLADAAEAAARAMTKATPGRIEATVRKLVRDRLNDGQLDHCDLTLKDLDAIADTFVQVLSGIFHARIEYPEAMEKELQRDPPPAAGAAAGGKST